MGLAAARPEPFEDAPQPTALRVVSNREFDRRTTALFEAFRSEPREELFRQLLDEAAPRLEPMVQTKLRLLGRKLDARDVVLDTFAQVFRHRATFRDSGAGSFVKWFLAVAENMVHQDSRSAMRRMRRERLVARRVVDRQADPLLRLVRVEDADAAAVTWHELRRVVLEGLRLLPSSQCEALVHFTQERLSYEELAERLGTTRGAVVMRIQRARKQLLRHLRDQLCDPVLHARVLRGANAVG